MVERPTHDLDLFTPQQREIAFASTLVRTGLGEAGLTVEVVRSGSSFTRLAVSGGAEEATLVDLAWDARVEPPVSSEVGPILALTELAADKVLALFGRAEARDLVDIHALSGRLPRARLLELAAAKDAGFDTYIFAQALARAEDRPRADFPLDDAQHLELLGWSREWRNALLTDLTDG